MSHCCAPAAELSGHGSRGTWHREGTQDRLLGSGRPQTGRFASSTPCIDSSQVVRLCQELYGQVNAFAARELFSALEWSVGWRRVALVSSGCGVDGPWHEAVP